MFDAGWNSTRITVWGVIKLSGRHTTQTQTSEVRWAARFTGHRVVTSMFAKVTPERPSHRQLKKTSTGRRSQLNQYWSYKPHSNFKPTLNFLKILYVSFKWYFWQKILMSVLGLNSKDRKSTREKANISYPKVNRGCAPLTANRISADCVQILLGHSIPYIPLGDSTLC